MAKSKKKPLKTPVKTELSEDIELTLKIGDDTYVIQFTMWKELKSDAHSS